MCYILRKKAKNRNCPQVLDLADKNIRAAIINMFIEVKEAMLNKLKESMTTVNQQIKANIPISHSETQGLFKCMSLKSFVKNSEL